MHIFFSPNLCLTVSSHQDRSTMMVYYSRTVAIDHYQGCQSKPYFMSSHFRKRDYTFCKNGRGNMTKMASIFFFWTQSPTVMIHGSSIRASSLTQFIYMMILVWPWPNLWQSQLLNGNHKFNNLETRHGPSGSQMYRVYINDFLGLILTYFTAKLNLFIVLKPDKKSGERLQDH